MPLVRRGTSKFWYAQFQLNNRTYVRSTKTTDRREAEKVEAQFRTEAHSEAISGRRKQITFGEAITEFIATKERTPNHKNLLNHRKAVHLVFSSGLPLQSLTSGDLERYVLARQRLGRSAQTIKHEVNLIMGAVRFAKRNRYGGPDLTSPSLKIASGRLRYLSIEEERALLRALDPNRVSNGLAPLESRSQKKTQAVQDNYDLVLLLLDTGARYNEIAGLTWDQIDLERGIIRLWRSKVKNESPIFMTSRVRITLANRLLVRETKYVFSNSEGGPRGYRVVAIRKALDRAGLHDCTVHTLRHTHASRLVQNGMSVYEVKSVLGHADIRTTMRYAHLEQAAVTSRARDLIEKMLTS